MTSRRDELANLRDDLQDRLTRRRQERAGRQAGLGGDSADRALRPTATAAYEIVDQAAQALGCELVQIACLSKAHAAARPIAGSAQDADPRRGGVGAVGDLSTLRWPRACGSR